MVGVIGEVQAFDAIDLKLNYQEVFRKCHAVVELFGKVGIPLQRKSWRGPAPEGAPLR